MQNNQSSCPSRPSRLLWFLLGIGGLIGANMLVSALWTPPSQRFPRFMLALSDILEARGADGEGTPANLEVLGLIFSLADQFRDNAGDREAVLAAARNANSLQDLVPALQDIQAREARLQGGTTAEINARYARLGLTPRVGS
jgi:hypothetical protein